MYLIRLAYLHRESIALVATTVASLFLFFSNASQPVKALQGDFADLAEIVFTPQQWYHNILAVREENNHLKETIVQLNLLNAKLIQYQTENEKLRALLNLTDTSPISLLPARVVNQALLASVHSIIIDAGKDQGLVPNLGVMDLHGLLGKIISVGDHAAQIQLITDKNFKVSVRVGKTRELGILNFEQGFTGQIDGIRRSLHLEVGSLVFTSGISDVFPADIPVARIVSVQQNDHRAFQDIKVEILADIHNFDHVFVIQ